MILLIDNYDSFTYNLFDYLSQIGCSVLVKRNDEINLSEIQVLAAEAIVISPGPKTPSEAGITMDVIARFHTSIPILGICLGYQALGTYFGASLIKSKKPTHGKTSPISHNNDLIFHHVPQQVEVMRYHSLNISDIPPDIKIIAQTKDNEPMALKHTLYNLYGLQFHPESILTTHGMQILKNWYAAIR